MHKFSGVLLRNKFLISILSIGLLSFLGLYIGEVYFALAPRVSGVFTSVATALLTSGVVGFVFEYLTRKEFTAVIESTIANEVRRLDYLLLGGKEQKSPLFSFWRPFVSESTSIMIAQDESGVEPIVRVADISAAFSVYKELEQKFVMPEDHGKLEIDYVSKYTDEKDLCTYNRHLIIIGAPGANPLAVCCLNQLHGNTTGKKIRNGYIFAVNNEQQQKYLQNPYIIPCGRYNPGIWEMKDGEPGKRFERFSSSHSDGIGHDSCLIEYGMLTCDNGQKIYILLIAGHSRFSCMDGINFILNNEEWAEQISKYKGGVASTVLETSFSIAHGRVVKVAQHPH